MLLRSPIDWEEVGVLTLLAVLNHKKVVLTHMKAAFGGKDEIF